MRGVRDADPVMNDRSGSALATAMFTIAVAAAIILLILYV